MITIPIVVVPMVITAIIWAAAILWPTGPSGGSYNWGPAIAAAFHGVLAIIATLLAWLLFFVFLWVTK